MSNEEVKERSERGGGGTGERGEESSVWERELEQELQDLDLQVIISPFLTSINQCTLSQGLVSGEGNEGGVEEETVVDPETWENEIQEMLDMHSDEPPTQN